MGLENLYDQLGQADNMIEIQPVDNYEYNPPDNGIIVEKHLAIPEADTTETKPEKKTRKGKAGNGDAADQLVTSLRALVGDSINEERVREIVKESVRESLASVAPRTIEVKVGEVATKIEGRTHYQFELVLKAIASGVNLAMTGPAATSKTTMAVQAATALGKEYMIFRPMHSPSQAEGYNSAIGEYIQSNLYRAHKAGMVAIFDEFDASDPGITLVINSILDNKVFTYPNGETVSNPDFQVIMTMNTKGTGSDRKYVGRNRLDAATLDRVCVLEVDRDLSLEASLIGIVEEPQTLRIAHGGIPDAQSWLSTVRQYRDDYSKSHPDKIVSMRAVRDGYKLLSAGIGATWAVKMAITK